MKRWSIDYNAGLDPDFDELGGELTLAQIRDPGLTLAQIWNTHGAGDPEVSQRQRGLISYQRYQHDRLARQHRQLQRLSKRFLDAQRKAWPKFNFGWVYKCNACVPYNGHHTVNYWGTGQVDCW